MKNFLTLSFTRRLLSHKIVLDNVAGMEAYRHERLGVRYKIFIVQSFSRHKQNRLA